MVPQGNGIEPNGMKMLLGCTSRQRTAPGPGRHPAGAGTTGRQSRALERRSLALYPKHSLACGAIMNHDSYPDSYIAGILQEAKSFAIVGASANTVRPSYFVLKYLLAKGYRVFPVNPGLAGGEICGQKVFANLEALAEPVDVIDIFRGSEAALDIVRGALALNEKLGIEVIWMQLGVRNDEAARLAEEAGLKVVMNRCPKIEYGRLSGEIAWAGVNNRVISSRRPVILGTGYQQLSIRKEKL